MDWFDWTLVLIGGSVAYSVMAMITARVFRSVGDGDYDDVASVWGLIWPVSVPLWIGLLVIYLTLGIIDWGSGADPR